MGHPSAHWNCPPQRRCEVLLDKVVDGTSQTLTDEVSALPLAERLESLLPLPRKRKKELQEDLHRLINLRSKQ